MLPLGVVGALLAGCGGSDDDGQQSEAGTTTIAPTTTTVEATTTTRSPSTTSPGPTVPDEVHEAYQDAGLPALSSKA